MKIIELKKTDSTNDHAKQLAREGAASGTVVWAHEQTAGRGRQGNTWVSIPGNLFMSMIIRPQISAEHFGQLSFLSAVALANVLEKIIPALAQINLKWPNDLLINQKKAAGILIETEGKAPWAVVGIGVNVSSAPPGAISLSDIGVKTHSAREILELLAQEMQVLVQAWEKTGFAPIRAAWLERAYKHGEEITARLPKETLKGIFKGIDPAGALQLQMTNGIVKTINSAEVFI
jgi:BirA family biotin operon repressor/biotin-[acetyl-CoA-carboxylase] ligase